MESARVRSDERGSTVWRVALAERPEGKPFVRWYGVFTPPAPIPLPGKASAIGLQANGRSAWNRIIYEITDAKGEIWQSIGVRDAWNCDDIHSWSYLNHDGWRWMEFPLPGNAPGDDFREKDSVWWNHSDDGIVDLPVRLSRIIVEMSTHQIYVNEALPVEDLSVEFDDLTAVYADAEMMTDKPVAAQRAAAGVLRPSRETTPALPNPLEELSRAGVGAPPEILRLEPPETGHDGTRIFAVVGPVEGAAEYRAWVAAYPDGRGAQVFAKGPDPKLLLRRLKPNLTLYFFATYLDAEGKESKPSAAHRSVLKDEFPMK